MPWLLLSSIGTSCTTRWMNTEEHIASDLSNMPASQGGGIPFFSSPELVQRLDLLRHLIESSDLIPLVKGTEGAGKSTLIEQIISRATENWLLCHIKATPMLQPEQLFIQLASAFNTTISGRDALDTLGQRFSDLRREGRLPIIIVDDAHLLPEMTIITLLQLYARLPEDRPMVRILLFAEPDVDALLGSPQIKDMGLSVLQALDMPLLSREQTALYIEHILAGSGGAGLEMSPVQTEKIYADSGGLPGRIEQLVQESMSSGVVQWGAVRLSRVSPLATVGTIAVVAILLLLLLFQDSINALFGVTEEGEPGVEVISDGEVLLELPPTSAPFEPPAVIAVLPSGQPEPEVEQKVELEESTENQVEVALEPSPELPAEVDLPVVGGVEEELQADPVVLVEVPPEPVEAIVAAESVPLPPPDVARFESEESPPEPVETSPVIATLKPEPEEVVTVVPVEKKMVPVEPEPVVVEEREPSPAKPLPPPSRPKPAPVRDVVLPKAPAKSSQVVTGVRQESWLLQQRPASYTLQLIGLQNAQGIPRFIQRHSLVSKAAYFRTSHNGSPWFVVLYGVYPDRAAAVKARASLPPPLRSSDVWPRSFDSVQQEIRNR